MKIHLGCGPRILEGWLNLDIDPVEGAYPADVTDLKYNPDCTASHIYCEDLFEHLDQKQQLKFLSECFRVLEPEGLCRITFPELFASLLREDDPWAWGHLLIPTADYFVKIAEWVGFQVEINDRNAGVQYGFPEDLRPFPPREQHENVFATLEKPWPAPWNLSESSIIE